MNYEEINAVSSSTRKIIRKHKHKNTNLHKLESTSRSNHQLQFVNHHGKMILKTNKKAQCGHTKKAIKLGGKSDKKEMNSALVNTPRKIVKIQERERMDVGIEDDRQSEVTQNRSLKKQKLKSCESAVETLTTEMSADVVTETNKRDVNEDMVSDSDKCDEKTVSNLSFCSGDIFCDCNDCELCRKSLLNTKLSSPEKKLKFICALCNKKFAQESHLKGHEKRKCDSVMPFSCDYCTKTFTTKNSKESHIKIIHCNSVKKKELFNCNLCEKNLSSKESLINHKINIHLFANLKGTYSCKTCEKVYKYEWDLNQHVRQFHSDAKFECGHCSDIFKSKRKLIKHIQRAHFPSILKCGKCLKTFASAPSLNNHLQSVHSDSKVDRGVICETCGKCVSSKIILRKHLLTHTSEKPYICQVCGKSFRTDSNLQQHSHTHSDKRPFSCDLCSKTFRIKHHVRQHMAVHGMIHTSVRRKLKNN